MGQRTIALLVVSIAFISPAEPVEEYVGSKSCRGCHSALYDAYIRTPMGRSITAAPAHISLSPDKKIIGDETLGRTFEVWTDSGTLHQAESSEQFRTAHTLAYAIGSGMNGLTFLVRRGDHLFQAPLSYYSRSRTWALSPGYEDVDYGFNRPIAAACIACHSGRPRPITNRNGQFDEPPFREMAIGCESCHGPGRKHVDSGGGKQSIVNPARLNPSLAEDICMYCHQGGDTRIVQPGRTILDHRPGQPLNSTVAIFKIPRAKGDTRQPDLLEHHESMRLSRCYQASNGKMTCITCHSPHPAKRDIRSTCLSCHSQPFAKGHPVRASNCIECHMPKRNVGFIAHSALTNHRIPRRGDDPLPGAAFSQVSPDLPDLVYFNRASGRSAPLLTLLQAYGELIEKHPPYYERFQVLLDRAAIEMPEDPLVLASLGRRALRSNDIQLAIARLRQAVDKGSESSTTFEDLGEALARTEQLEEAVGVLRRGIELAPFTPVLYKSLVVRYIKLQRYDAAKQTLMRYVELFPQDDFMRKMLAQVSGPR